MISSSGDHLIAKLSCNNLLAKLSPIQKTKIKANLNCYELFSNFWTKDGKSIQATPTGTKVRAPMHPKVLARHPTKARGTTQKPPHPQIKLDSCAVLPKIPPGFPGLQILGSHRQDQLFAWKTATGSTPDPCQALGQPSGNMSTNTPAIVPPCNHRHVLFVIAYVFTRQKVRRIKFDFSI